MTHIEDTPGFEGTEHSATVVSFYRMETQGQLCAQAGIQTLPALL